MKKLLYNLVKVIMIIFIGVVVWKCAFNHSEKEETSLPKPLSVYEHNRQCYEDVREGLDLLAITALVEGFHKRPYDDKTGKWTIGFGTTIYPDGKIVKSKDKPISLPFAKQCVKSHYDTHVWPWIKYVKRKLNHEQMVGACCFIYNNGGEAFSGHDKYGNVLKVKKTIGKGKKAKTIWVTVPPSSFLLAINEGKSDYEVAIRMNGFRSITVKGKKRLASGLPKRHWIEGAIYLGRITTEDILNLEPKRFYEKNKGFDISFYYKNRKGPYWTHDYSKEKVREFLQKNHSDKNNVRALI